MVSTYLGMPISCAYGYTEHYADQYFPETRDDDHDDYYHDHDAAADEANPSQPVEVQVPLVSV